MLLMCLREIETSGLFIGLYGERYGWSVHEGGKTNSELLTQSFDLAAKEFPWINLYRDRSVTEVEMRMILERNYTGPDKNAWFYLRDKYFVEEVPQKDRPIYASEGPQSETRLATLKKNIEKSPFVVHPYHRPSNIAELVYTDLIKHIEKKFPKGIEGSPIEKERFQHAVYLRTLCRTYLAREEYFHQVDRYVASNNQFPLTIIGESGIGKSALCANWIVRHSSAHPEDLLLYHFVGCSSSSHYSDLLWRIMTEVKEHMKLGDSEKIPDSTNYKEIQQAFPDFMKKAMDNHNPKRRRLVLIIDGLNKLDDRDNTSELLWFPKRFPVQVRVIVTTTFPNRYYEVLKKRGNEIVQIEPLPEAERKSFLRMYLSLYSKRLSEKQEFNIAKENTTSNPRFLQTLLDDISVFGDFDKLESRISRVLSAKNTSTLYEIVLERLEKDYDPQNKGIVRHFVSLVWAARRGIPLDALGRLLEKRGIMGQQWSALFVVMEDFLSTTSGLMSFTNDDIKLAIKNRYFIKADDVLQVHKILADYYLSLPDLSASKVEELPYQLLHAHQYDQLAECLSDMQIFERLYTTADKYDLFHYWRELEQISSTKYDVARCYSLDENYSTASRRAAGMIMSDLLYDVGCFLEEMAKYQGAEKAYIRSRGHYQNSSQQMEVAKVNSALAKLYHTQGRHKEAESMFSSCLEIYLKQKGEDCMEVCVLLNRLGSLYTTQKRYAEAKTTLQRAMRISESHFGADSLIAADVAYSLGVVHLVEPSRMLDVAEQWFQRALSILESHYGDKHTDVANIYNRLGSLYMEQDQFNDAEDCLKRSLAIREKWLGVRHSRVAQTLRTLLSLYEMQERYSESIECGLRALEITKSIFGNEHSHVIAILLRLGIMYYVSGNDAEGLKTLNAALAIRKKQPNVTEESIKEVVDLIDSFEHPEKLQQQQQQQQKVSSVPKPPPAPPKPSGSLASVLMGSLAAPTRPASGPPRPPGGPPPPPPPPPVGYSSATKPPPPPPPQKASSYPQKSAIGGLAGENDEMDNDVSKAILREIKLKAYKGEKKDKSDARENALAMLGNKQKKMVWKSKKK
jgi:nephrocystin-3